MQTPSISSPSPNPEMLNMIRNPGAQPAGQPSGANAPQPSDTAQPGAGEPSAAPSEGAPAASPGEAGGVSLPQGGQTVAEAGPLPGAELPLPELPAMEIPAPRQDGNFFDFLQKLADTPRFSEGMNQLLLRFPGMAEAGHTAGTASAEGAAGATAPALPPELNALAQLLPQNETEAAAFLKQQTAGGSRFAGELFDVLRTAYAESGSKSMKTDILQFVRRFSDYTSAPHIESAMVRTLGQLAKTLPKAYSGTLEGMAQSLEKNLAEGDRGGTLRLLQGKILPFLKDIGDSHPDLRLPNTLISIFKPLAARFENGSEDGLLQAFRQLAERRELKPALSKFTDLQKLFSESRAAKAAENRRFAEQLVKTADWAMKGKGGGEPRKLFRQLISNELLNKSVYLPLEHALLPMEWNGKRLLSELWIDPDAGDDGRSESGKERLIRFLLHMDVPGLGPVDLLLACRGEAVELQLSCPETVVPFSEQIQQEMTRILENNGLKPEGIQIQKWEKPLTLPAAFPKLSKRGSGVNMKI